MKKNIWLCLLALLLVACDKIEGTEPIVSKEYITKDYINVVSSLSLLGDGQEAELMISANCSWSISYSASWLTVTPLSGSNNETVKVSADKNSTGQERTVTLTIEGGNAPTKNVVVTQGKGTEEPVVKTLSSNTTSLSFEAKEESKTFTISSNTNWTISKPDWCTLSVSSGDGNADVVVTVAENPNKEQRSGQIVISGEGTNSITISINQKGKDTTNSQEPGSDDNLPPS